MSKAAEIENTARRLKDEPLLATSFWCRFGWHRWRKWTPAQVSGIYIIQDRYCDCCGVHERRAS